MLQLLLHRSARVSWAFRKLAVCISFFLTHCQMRLGPLRCAHSELMDPFFQKGHLRNSLQTSTLSTRQKNDNCHCFFSTTPPKSNHCCHFSSTPPKEINGDDNWIYKLVLKPLRQGLQCGLWHPPQRKGLGLNCQSPDCN